MPTATLLTLDQFERLPDTDGIQELLDGELIEMPPPKRRHSELCKNLEGLLRRVLDSSRIWLETGFSIAGHCPQPDVAVIFPDHGMDRGWFAEAPMVAIEVASRGNTPEQLEWKKELYLAHGAQEVWLVYDKTRTVVVHRPDGQAITYKADFQSLPLKTLIDFDAVFQ